MELEDVDPVYFQRVLDLWCGRDCEEFESVRQLMHTAGVAERFQVEEVSWALEEAVLGQLSVETCAEVLMGSERLGLRRAEAAAEELALARFEEVARTAGFVGLGEEAVGRLVDDDRLDAGSEERVFECVVGWMAGGGAGGDGRGPEPLGKVRFLLMDAGYLAREVEGRVPAEHREWAKGVVKEACGYLATPLEERGLVRMEQLGGRAGRVRVGMGVKWERHGVGKGSRIGGLRLPVASAVLCMAECGGRVCCGCWDGTIAVWDRATLTLERTLPAETLPANDDHQVCCLFTTILTDSWCRGRIFSDVVAPSVLPTAFAAVGDFSAHPAGVLQT